jgi:hypothetical protein
MKVTMKLLGFGTLLLLFLLNACASSKITGEWKDPELGSKKFSHILVIGAAKQPDRRKFYEDEFVKQLNRQGVMAIASYTILPRDEMLNKDAIVKSIQGLQIDAVIITRSQGLKEQRQVPYGKTYQIPYGYYNNMYDYYSTSVSAAPAVGYAENHEYLQLETNLYDAETEKLAFSITTDTFVREKFNSRITSYIETVVQKLKNTRLL